MWVIAPEQEVRSQQAVQADQRQRDGQGLPLGYSATYQYFPDDPHLYVFPEPLPPSADSTLTSRPLWDYIDAFMPKHNGQHLVMPSHIPKGPQTQTLARIAVTLEGRRTDPVLIKSITAQVVARRPPLDGTLFSVGAQGENDIHKFVFDLDARDLSARVFEDGQIGPRYDSAEYLFLEKGEPMVVHFSALTATCSCDWQINLEVRSGGRDEKMTIDDNGRPFTTTALARRYQREFSYVLMGGTLAPTAPRVREAS